MLGYDVKYSNDMADDHLIKIALEEKRTLLTHDYQLFRMASVHGLKAYLIQGRTEAEKLAEMAERFHIKLEMDVHNSRCPKCNTKISPVSKEEIKDKIPDSTSRFYNDFWICPVCSQIYWQGSHWKKINSTLFQAKQILEVSMKPKLNGCRDHF